MPDYSQPFIEAHISGKAAWIDMLWVPREQRRKGVGEALFEKWVAALPATVQLVRIFAADTGDGPSDAFWETLGFEYLYDSEEPSSMPYEDRQQMVLGVNGHGTPAPVDWDAI